MKVKRIRTIYAHPWDRPVREEVPQLLGSSIMGLEKTPMNVILQILKAGNLILTVEPIALEVAHKLKELFGGLDPELSLNIVSLEGAAIAADDQTVQLVADWKKQHGLS